MLMMLIGAVFAVVVRTLPVGAALVEVAAGCIGYALIAGGMGRVDRVEAFGKGRTVAGAAAVVSLLLGGIALLDLKAQAYILGSLAVLGVGSWAAWIIPLGLGELEKRTGVPMNGEKMKVAWMVHVTSAVLTYWCSVQGLTDLAAITMFLTPAAGAFYCILFFSGWRGYVDYSKSHGGLTP